MYCDSRDVAIINYSCTCDGLAERNAAVVLNDHGVNRSSQDVVSTGPRRRNSFLKAATAARWKQPATGSSGPPAVVPEWGRRPADWSWPCWTAAAEEEGRAFRSRIWRVMPTSSSSMRWSSSADTSMYLQCRLAATFLPSARHHRDTFVHATNSFEPEIVVWRVSQRDDLWANTIDCERAKYTLWGKKHCTLFIFSITLSSQVLFWQFWRTDTWLNLQQNSDKIIASPNECHYSTLWNTTCVDQFITAVLMQALIFMTNLQLRTNTSQQMHRCSECLPLALTRASRRSRHWLIAWSVMICWIPDHAKIVTSGTFAECLCVRCVPLISAKCQFLWPYLTGSFVCPWCNLLSSK